MPFKSQAQRRKFHAMADRGEISERTVERWEEETPKGKKLPERVKKALARLRKQANGDGEEENENTTQGKKVPQKVLTTFFHANPSPEDEQVHELAEAYGTDPHTLEEQVYRMVANKVKTSADQLPGGLADAKTNRDYAARQMAMGRKVEMEHTDDPAVAEEISRDHLEEFPNYYTALDKMERELEQQQKKAAYALGSQHALQTLNLSQ